MKTLEDKLRFKLCIPYRDFPVGGSLADIIIEHMTKSRVMIIVLSKVAVRKPWFMFECETAFTLTMNKTDKREVMLIQLEKLNMRSLDGSLKSLYQNRTVLTWPKDAGDLNITHETKEYLSNSRLVFWYRLGKALHSGQVSKYQVCRCPICKWKKPNVRETGDFLDTQKTPAETQVKLKVENTDKKEHLPLVRTKTKQKKKKKSDTRRRNENHPKSQSLFKNMLPVVFAMIIAIQAVVIFSLSNQAVQYKCIERGRFVASEWLGHISHRTGHLQNSPDIDLQIIIYIDDHFKDTLPADALDHIRSHLNKHLDIERPQSISSKVEQGPYQLTCADEASLTRVLNTFPKLPNINNYMLKVIKSRDLLIMTKVKLSQVIPIKMFQPASTCDKEVYVFVSAYRMMSKLKLLNPALHTDLWILDNHVLTEEGHFIIWRIDQSSLSYLRQRNMTAFYNLKTYIPFVEREFGSLQFELIN